MRKLFLILLLLPLLILTCQKSDDEVEPIIGEVAKEEVLRGHIDLELNPSGNVPLAARAQFETLLPTSISLTINGTFNHDFTAFGSTHKLGVLGLKPGINNQLIFTIKQNNGQFAKDTLWIETAALPEYMPDIHIVEEEPNKMEPGFTLCEFLYGRNGKMITLPFMFDNNGFICWYLEIEELDNFINPVKRLQNGNLIFGLDQVIYEYDMLGFEVNKWQLDGFGQHHDIIEKPDGNLLIAATNKNLETIEDQIIELNRSTGVILNTWDLREIMDIDRFDLVWNSRDWLHVNSLWYDEVEQSILISARHQGILKITKENELEWILAPKIGWGNAGLGGQGKPTADFLLTAVNEEGLPYVEEVQIGDERAADFDWPWGQHDASWLPNGNVLTFDNGYNRNFRAGEGDLYSRGVEYKIDLENLQVSQVWEYGQTLGPAFYSRNLGSADYLPETGNRLLCSGNIHYDNFKRSKIIELTFPGINPVFEVDINFANFYGSGVDAWGQTDMVYRAKRWPLYP